MCYLGPNGLVGVPSMLEMTGEVPFLWRLCACDGEGFYSVAMVVPGSDDSRAYDLSIEIGVLGPADDLDLSEKEEILEWNRNDIDLFLRLVNQRQLGRGAGKPDTLRLDLTDPEVIDVVHIVAAAGFGFPYLPGDALKDSAGEYPRHKAEVGGLASLNTIQGFKSCVVVDVAEEEVACVLLDDLEIDSREGDASLYRNDLVVVGHTDVLHPAFAQPGARPDSAMLH